MQPPTPSLSERRVAAIGALLVGLGPMSLALFTPAMPQIAAAFQTSVSTIQLSISLYFAGFAGAQLISGPLADAYGRRPVLLAFLLLYLVASVGAMLAPTVDILLASRFLQGFGAAAGVSVSRAIVRDLFASDRSARIMNLMSLMLSIGPSIAPTIGGITMQFFGWPAIFALMVLLGLANLGLVLLLLAETGTPDASLAHPARVLRTYAAILRDRSFLTSSLTLAGTIGAFYAQSAVLSVIVVGQLHYSGLAFGLMMLGISGSYSCGAIAVGWLIPRYGALRLVPFGLFVLLAAGTLLAVLLLAYPPSAVRLLVPIMAFTFGNAFILPAMYTATLTSFPANAGAASAMSGFLQMATGLAGSVVASLMSDPSLALAILTPLMAIIATSAWWRWQRLARQSASIRD